MKESVFGKKETENLNTEYQKPPAQPKCVEQAVLYYSVVKLQLCMKRTIASGKTFLTS